MNNQRHKQIWFELTKRRKILEQKQDIKDINIYSTTHSIKSESDIVNEDEEFFVSEK